MFDFNGFSTFLSLLLVVSLLHTFSIINDVTPAPVSPPLSASSIHPTTYPSIIFLTTSLLLFFFCLSLSFHASMLALSLPAASLHGRLFRSSGLSDLPFPNDGCWPDGSFLRYRVQYISRAAQDNGLLITFFTSSSSYSVYF